MAAGALSCFIFGWASDGRKGLTLGLAMGAAVLPTLPGTVLACGGYEYWGTPAATAGYVMLFDFPAGLPFVPSVVLAVPGNTGMLVDAGRLICFGMWLLSFVPLLVKTISVI